MADSVLIEKYKKMLKIDNIISETQGTIINGDVTILSDINILGDCIIDGNMNIDNSLHASGNIIISNDLIVNTSLNILSSLSSVDFIVNDTLNVSNNITVGGDIFINDSCLVSGTSTIVNTLNISGITNCDNTITCDNINSIGDTINIFSDIINIGNINSTINLVGTSYNIVNNELIIKDRLITLNHENNDIGNNSGIEFYTASGMGYIKTNNDATRFVAKAPTDTTERYIATLDLNYNLHVSNNMIINQDATCLGNLNIVGNGIVGNDLTALNNINVSNDCIIDGSVNCNNITTNTLNINNISVTNSVNVINDILVNNNSTVIGTLTVSGNSIINNNCTVTNNINVGGDLVCSNNMTVSNNMFVSGNTIINNNFTANNNMFIGGNTIIDGILTVSSSLNVSGNTTVEGNMTILGDFTVNGDSIINGTMSVSNSSSIITILGDVFSTLENYTDNSDAIAGGVPLWGLYRTGGIVKICLPNLPPIITLTGDNPVEIEKGDNYIEVGISAIDAIDGNNLDTFLDSIANVTVSNILSSPIPISTGSVITDVNTLLGGSYTITYSSYDEIGNPSTDTRLLTIISPIYYYAYSFNWSGLPEPPPTDGHFNFTDSEWTAGINDSNVFVVGGIFGFPSALDYLSTRQYVALISWRSAASSTDINSGSYDINESQYEFMLSKSFMDNNSIDMNKVGQIIKVNAIDQSTQSTGQFRISVNTSTNINENANPSISSFAVFLNNKSDGNTFIRFTNKNNLTLCELYGTSYSIGSLPNAHTITGGPRDKFYKSGNTGIFVQTFQEMIGNDLHFKISIYAKQDTISGITEIMKFEGIDTNASTTWSLSGSTVSRVPMRFRWDRPAGKLYDGFCVTTKFIDFNEFFTYFPSAGIFDNNYLTNNIFRASDTITFPENNIYVSLATKYLSAINNDEYSTIYKLKGPTTDRYAVSSGWNTGGKIFVQITETLVRLGFSLPTTSVTPGTITENPISGTTINNTIAINETYVHSGFNYIQNGVFVQIYYKKVSSTSMEFKVHVYAYNGSSIQQIFEISAGTATYSSTYENVTDPVVVFKDSDTVNDYGGVVLSPTFIDFDEYKYYFNTIDNFS